MSQKFHTIKKVLFLNRYRRKKLSEFTKNYGTVLFGQKYGSGIRKNLFRIPDPGVKKAPDPRSGYAIPKNPM
jgi:hypothetical protein